MSQPIKSKEDEIIERFKKMIQDNQSQTSLKELIEILNATRFYAMARGTGRTKKDGVEIDLQFIEIDNLPGKEFLPLFTSYNLCMEASKTIEAEMEIFNFGFAEFLHLILPILKNNDLFGGFILNPFGEKKESLLMQKTILFTLYEQIKREVIQSPENILVPLFHRNIPKTLPEISEIYYIPLQKVSEDQKDVLLFDCPSIYSKYYKSKLELLLRDLRIDKYHVMYIDEFDEPLLLSTLKVLYERDLIIENLN